MAVSVNVLSQKWTNQFRNGANIDTNPNDFARNLVGLIGMRTKVVIQYRFQVVVDWRDFSGLSVGVVNGGTNTRVFITLDNIDWEEEGFYLGQRVYVLFEDGSGPSFAGKGIDSQRVRGIVGNTIELQVSGNVTFTVNAVILYMIEPLIAARHKFGLVENNGQYSNQSLITSNDMGYYATDFGFFGTPAAVDNRQSIPFNMEAAGLTNDWVTGSAKIKWVENKFDDIAQFFEVEHEFVIHPLYIDGQLQALKRREAPDYLAGDASLKYAFNTEFREVFNNPNRAFPVQIEDKLGSVGWFGESFNAYDNNYEAEILNISDFDNPSQFYQGINPGVRNKVRVKINRKSGNMVIGDMVGGLFYHLPSADDYTNTQTNMIENFILGSCGNRYGGGVGVSFSNGVMNGSNPTVNLDGSITYQLVLTFTNDQAKFLAEEIEAGRENYVLAVYTGTDEEIVKTDLSLNLLGVGKYDYSADIPDLATLENFKIIPPDGAKSDAGFTNMTSWNEDGLYFQFDMILMRAKRAEINSLGVGIVAFNPTTQESFILDQQPIDLSNTIVDGSGRRTITLDTTRGYELANNSIWNFLKITTSAIIPFVESNITYSFEVGQKIPWQDWIANRNVPFEFIDTLKRNNNQNDKASNYSGKEGFEIRFAVIANLFGFDNNNLSGDTDYLLMSQPITVYDYRLDGNQPALFSGVIQTFKASNMTPIGTKILSGEDTVFRCTWSRSDGPAVDPSIYWGLHRIEVTDDAGFQIEELASMQAFSPDNTLQPLSGETDLKISIVGGNIVTECLIKGSNIQSNLNYNISARIHSTETPGDDFKEVSPSGGVKNSSGSGSSGKNISTP